MAALKKKFSPEFVNRLDAVITYRSLGRTEYGLILDHILSDLASLVNSRMGIRGFRLQCTTSGRSLLLDIGSSIEYGARELKRTVQRNFTQPVAALVSQGRVPPGSTVILDASGGEFSIRVRP